ncbi:hypothetical protein U5N28_04025 [Lysinibacillus telephonicus]|uniref:DUF3953 domain-containing protein n=1 Tax=Lysinibacillus telephonicus TaxID=1714840 RepID=A0A431UTK1_9BACI|nr:hypothetical protein [Lysinibacillus telephonicus]RTQ92996.1 hypothetical protein EKG35_10070 [Lysinibacillus telephonicus]
MENKWSLVLFVQPVIGLLLILIGLYTFIAGSPHLLPWAFMLMGPLFAMMCLYERKRENKNTSIFYLTLAAISFLFGFYSFTTF